jgi:hypothetical protein
MLESPKIKARIDTEKKISAVRMGLNDREGSLRSY